MNYALTPDSYPAWAQILIGALLILVVGRMLMLWARAMFGEK